MIQNNIYYTIVQLGKKKKKIKNKESEASKEIKSRRENQHQLTNACNVRNNLPNVRITHSSLSPQKETPEPPNQSPHPKDPDS